MGIVPHKVSLTMYRINVDSTKSCPFAEMAGKPNNSQNWSSMGCDGLTTWSAGGGSQTKCPDLINRSLLPPVELGSGDIELVGAESKYNRESVFFMLF